MNEFIGKAGALLLQRRKQELPPSEGLPVQRNVHVTMPVKSKLPI